MTESNIHEMLKQVETNLILAADELGVPDHKTADDPEMESQKAAFFGGVDLEAEKSDDVKAAERLERIAEDSIVIAEAAGAPSYKVDGSATSAAEKNAGLFDPRK
jgi:outer membrane protein TolC